MPRKTKLRLQDLRVKSFVTLLNDDEKNGVKGGNIFRLIRLATLTIFSDAYDCVDDTNICMKPPVTFVACPTSPGFRECVSAALTKC
jgi:hypothetical protein